VADLVRDAARRLAVERPRLTANELRDGLAGLLGPRPAKCGLDPQTVRADERAACSFDMMTIETEPGFRLPMIRTASPQGAGPVVVMVSDGGKEHIAFDSALTREAARGMTVLAPDLRGQGELAADLEQAVTDTILSGSHLFGRQVYDLLRVVEYGREIAGGDAVTCLGTGPASALVAIYAAAMDEELTVVSVGPVASYADTFDTAPRLPQIVYLPGILELADVPDIAEAAGERLAIVNPQGDEASRRALAERCRVVECPREDLPDTLHDLLLGRGR